MQNAEDGTCGLSCLFFGGARQGQIAHFRNGGIMEQDQKKYIFTTQAGWINLHPWAMLLNVLAVLAIFLANTPLLPLAKVILSAWLYWWIFGYFLTLAFSELTGYIIWEPFWLYEMWDEASASKPVIKRNPRRE